MRAHGLNTTTARSKKKPDPKRKTVQLNLWVDPIVKRELQRIAEQEGLTVSKTGAALLKQALQNNVNMRYSELLTPIIETAIDKHMRSRDTRLAWLLVRVAYTGQTRSLVANILGRQQGMTEDILKNILAMSQRTAKGVLPVRPRSLKNSWKRLRNGLLRMRDRKSHATKGLPFAACPFSLSLFVVSVNRINRMSNNCHRINGFHLCCGKSSSPCH